MVFNEINLIDYNNGSLTDWEYKDVTLEIVGDAYCYKINKGGYLRKKVILSTLPTRVGYLLGLKSLKGDFKSNSLVGVSFLKDNQEKGQKFYTDIENTSSSEYEIKLECSDLEEDVNYAYINVTSSNGVIYIKDIYLYRENVITPEVDIDSIIEVVTENVISADVAMLLTTITRDLFAQKVITNFYELLPTYNKDDDKREYINIEGNTISFKEALLDLTTVEPYVNDYGEQLYYCAVEPHERAFKDFTYADPVELTAGASNWTDEEKEALRNKFKVYRYKINNDLVKANFGWKTEYNTQNPNGASIPVLTLGAGNGVSSAVDIGVDGIMQNQGLLAKFIDALKLIYTTSGNGYSGLTFNDLGLDISFNSKDGKKVGLVANNGEGVLFNVRTYPTLIRLYNDGGYFEYKDGSSVGFRVETLNDELVALKMLTGEVIPIENVDGNIPMTVEDIKAFSLGVAISGLVPSYTNNTK